MGSRGPPPPGKFTWRIEGFLRLTEKKYYSDAFTIGGCEWRLMMFPGGNTSDNFSIYLSVYNSTSLPTGWCIEALYSLTLVNQNTEGSSAKKEGRHSFKARQSDWGFNSFMPLANLKKRGNGFLVNDTLIVEVEVDVRSVAPPVVVPEPDYSPSNMAPSVISETTRFESFFSKFGEIILAAKEGSGSNSSENDQMDDLLSGYPSFEAVEKAKQSLKECLSDLFKLNMKDRLSAALLTLNRAEVGLSCDQQKSVKNFWENFDDFISDFLTFEQDNAEFELQRLARDKVFSAMKNQHDTHLSNKQLLESLTAEEEDLKKRMEEIKAEKEKLVSGWESLMTESEQAKSKYTAQEKKLTHAEEKKRIGEERMSRSTAAWSSLKAHFV